MNPQDRRVRKSKEALYKAAAILMKEKDLAEISIKELTDLADVNRGTFYAHYNDIYDFIESMENDIIEDLGGIFKRFSPHQNTETLFPMLEVIIKYFAAEPYCYLLTRSGQNSALISKLVKTIRDVYFYERIKGIFKSSKDAYDIMMYEEFVLSGFLTLIASWLENGKPLPPEQLAVKINKLVLATGHFLAE